MTERFSSRYAAWAALAAILALAAVLRFGAPGVVEFKRDEANLSQLALDMAHGKTFPLLGIGSSVGLPNAPVNVYVLAIPYLFDTSPLVATQFIELLNALAVLLTYWIARRYCGTGAALLAALLYAVSPWGLIYSRKIWAQDMLPFFVLLTLGTGLAAFVDGKRWAQWLFLPLLAIAGQIHYAAFVIIPAAAWLLWTGRKRLTRAFMLSLIPTALVLAPYLAGIAQAGLDYIEHLGETITTSEGGPKAALFTTEPIHAAALTIAGTEIHSLAGPEAFRDYLASVPDAYPLFGLLAWGALLASAWLIWRVWHKRDSRTPFDLTLALWVTFPVLAFCVTWTPFYPHYLIPMMPAAYMVMGVASVDLWKWLTSRPALRRMIFAGGGILLMAILVLQVWLWAALMGFLDSHNTPGGFGTPLHDLLDVREAILADDPTQVLGQFQGQRIGFDGEATVWNTLLYDVPSVRFEDTVTEVYPADDAILLARTCDNGGDSQTFMLRESEGCYSVGTRSRADLDLSEYTPIPEAENLIFANGARLLNYQWLDQTCLILAWGINQTADRDSMFAVHFLNASGERIAQADGLSWPGRFWQPGDAVIRRFCLAEANPAVAGVRLGMYVLDGTDFINIDLLDVNGTPSGQMIDVIFD